VEKVKSQKGIVQSLERKEKSEQQPLPYDLTELQRDANNRFGFSAKKTLSVLQKLYEQYKLVTYPRTDSRYLTRDMEGTMLDRLHGLASSYRDEVKPLIASKGKVAAKRVFNNEKVTDHHAIIPTEERSHLSDLSNDERKLYDMIVRRFLALFHQPYKYEGIKALIEVMGEIFTVNETVVIDPGFKKMTQKETTVDGKMLGKIAKGQNFTVQSVHLEKKLF